MDLKKKLNSYPQRTADEIIKKIQSYDVVSFDIFDTLLKRDVEFETDVFELVERKYNLEHTHQIKKFKAIRIAAEFDAREKNNHREVTIEDIYECLINSYSIHSSVANELRRLEEEIEKAVCTVNQCVIRAFEYCKTKQKRIIIISDMYWPASFVEELLVQSGITGYDAIYVSSEYGVQKRQNGALFRIVAEKENINVNKWIHIGDNKKADYISAKKIGITAFNIAKYYNQTVYLHKSKRNDLDKSVITSFVNNHVDSAIQNKKAERDDLKLGYEIYGPLLYFFVVWLHERIPPNVTVLFFARDCYVVKKAYELLYGAEDRYKYFLGSRKSLILAALHKDSSLETVAAMLKSEPIQMTVEGFLKKLNLEPADYEQELKESHLQLSSIIYRDRLTENSAFVDFYDRIVSDVCEMAKQNFEGIKSYISSMNCTKEIVVVDIGWRCTMQFCLQKIFPEYNWKGYYLGVREDAVVSSKQAEGFYIDGEDDFEKRCFLASLTALIEIFFSAPHGSVIGYGETGEILYAPYECGDDDRHGKFLTNIQNGALQFSKEFNISEGSRLIEISTANMLLGLEILGIYPHRRELEKIGDYPFHLGVGVINAADPKPLWKYIIDPKKFLFDFSNSTWKVAFLKRLLKLRLPYYKMFCWIYKHKV